MSRGLPAPDSLDFLIVAYGGGHIRAVLPVALDLQNRGFRISVLALTTAISVVQESGLDYFTYADLPENTQATVKQHGTRLAASFPTGGPIPQEETEAYLGVNYANLVESHGKERAATLYEKNGRQVFWPIHTMSRLLETLRPRVVIATNSPRSEQAAITAASALSIPAICVVDMFALQEIEWIRDPAFGQTVCVIDDGVKDHFVSRGRPAADIRVTGNPAFDGIYDPANVTAGQALRREHGWDGPECTVLYASTPEPEHHPFTGEKADPGLPLRLEERIRQAVAKNSNLQLVVRRHPSENQDVPLQDRVFQSTQAESIDALLHAVDLVVVTCSTVGLQAYLAGRPVLSVEGSVFSKDAPFGQFGMATVADTIDDLEPVLDAMLRARTQGMKSPAQTRTACDRVSAVAIETLKAIGDT